MSCVRRVTCVGCATCVVTREAQPHYAQSRQYLQYQTATAIKMFLRSHHTYSTHTSGASLCTPRHTRAQSPQALRAAQTGLSEKDAIGGGERGPASQFAAEGAAARLKRESSRLVLASVCHQASSSEFNPRAADAARNWKGAIKAIGLACAAGSRRPRGIGGSARPKLCTSARPHLACRKSGSLASLWRAHCHAATTHPQQAMKLPSMSEP